MPAVRPLFDFFGLIRLSPKLSPKLLPKLRPKLLPILLAAAMASATPSHAADLSKTLHVLIPNGEAGIDPATASEANTDELIEVIFDTLLQYRYLARPVALQPNVTRAMPELSADRLTYTFHLQPGIHFSEDPAFKGVPRELVAQDFVYSFKRLLDPTLRSPWAFLLADKLQGDEALKKKFNIDTPIAGLQAIDRFTLQVRLKQADVNFPFVLAMPAMSVVAREVIEAYADQPGGHPIGTGPFRVAEWQRGNRLLLQANPGFRRVVFDEAPGSDPADRAIAAALHGKTLPLVGQIEIKVIEENQSQLLGFMNHEFDYVQYIALDLSERVLSDGKLRPELAQRGVQLTLFPLLQTFYVWMNMTDPIVGGYTPEKIALRRAIALAYDRAEDIRVLEKGLSIPAQSPLPPNVLGYDPTLRTQPPTDRALAQALLDHYGYDQRDAEGYRTLPGGAPLTLTMHSKATSTGRLRDELWQRTLHAIGIRVVFKTDKYAEIIRQSRLGKVQMFEFGWVADYPDGENFLQLLYGPNTGVSNDARFDLPAYNALFEKARAMEDSPERTALYDDMARLIVGYAPWILRTHPLSIDIAQPWLRHYKRHPVMLTTWRYVDLDTAARARAQ